MESKGYVGRKETLDGQKHVAKPPEREHVARNLYSRAEISIHGLACPFAKSDPELYMNIDACKAVDGFKEVRLLLYVSEIHMG